MGFLELLGAMGKKKAGDGGLAGGIAELLGSGSAVGGMSGLLELLQSKGLGDAAASWVSKGKNLPVSAEQIQSALGDEHVRAIATRLGISPEKAVDAISRYLPQIVDRVTPDGKVPDAGALEKALSTLRAG